MSFSQLFRRPQSQIERPSLYQRRRRLRGTSSWVAALFLGTSLIAGAQEADVSELELFNLEQALKVKVSSATFNEQAIETAPSVVSVISQDQFRLLGLRTLKDVVQMMAGVTVLDDQFGNQQIAIRGIANPANILVTLDGQRLNDIYDASYFGDLSLEYIERIELIRGPGSALYGTNAFFGVVNCPCQSEWRTHS